MGASPPIRGLVAVFVGALLYAVVRYHLFGGISLEQLPLFIGNKAVSASAVLCLLLAAHHYRRGNNSHSAAWGRWSLHLAAVHVILSLMLLAPAYYGRFFDPKTDRLTGTAEVAMLFGALAAYGFWRLSRIDYGQAYPFRLVQLTTLGVGLHLLFQGGSKWHPSNWYGGMPNISLICLAVVIVTLVHHRRPS